MGAVPLGAVTISGGSTGLLIGSAVTGIVASSFTVLGTVPTTLQNTATLTINTSSNSTGAISFGGTINGTSSGVQSLTLAAGSNAAVTFGSSIGQSVPLNDLDILSAATTANAVNIGSDITATSFIITTASPATLTASSTITTTDAITFPATIDGTTAGTQALTLSSLGAITLDGNVGATTRLGAMTIDTGASGLSIGANVTTINAASFTVQPTVPTVLNNTALLTINTIGAIAFGGTIDGVTSNAQALTLTAGSTVTLFQDVGDAPLGPFTIGAGATDLIIGPSVLNILASSFQFWGRFRQHSKIPER